MDVLRAGEAGAFGQDRADRAALDGLVVAMPCILPVTVINEPRTLTKQTHYWDWLSFLLTCC